MQLKWNPKARGPAVLICLPAYSTVFMQTMMSIEGALQDLNRRKVTVGMMQGQGTYVHDARNNCVIQAYKQYSDRNHNKPLWTHLMFVDSDMAFEPELVWGLLQRRKDIVGGCYVQKAYPFLPNVGTLNKDGITYNMRKPDVTGKSGELIPVDMIGTGLMLIHRRVFDAFDDPNWFEFLPVDLPEHMHEMVTPRHKKTRAILGEDVAFCRKARELGFEIWCDLENKGTHIGNYGYCLKDHLHPNVQAAVEASKQKDKRLRGYEA